MDWQFLTLIGSNLGIMLTFFGISTSLINRSDARAEAQVNAIRENIIAIQNEMKDFHGKLCAIEERNKNR
jgi:hypothetical protein